LLLVNLLLLKLQIRFMASLLLLNLLLLI